MKTVSVGKIILATALALLAALVSPILLASSLSFLAVPVALVCLYAWAGSIPAAVYTLGSLAMFSFMGGNVFMWACFLALFLPAAVAVAAIRAHRSYIVCLRVSITAQIAGLLLGLLVAWLTFRADLVDVAMRYFSDRLKEMPSAMVDQLLTLYGQLGRLPSTGIDFAKGYLTSAERVEAIERFVAAATDGMKVTLPGLLLTSGTATGVINVAAPVWIWARRGDEKGIRRIPLSDWRMSRNSALGLPAAVIAAYILARAGVSGGDAVFFAAWYLLLLLFKLQALGSVSRLLKARGRSRGWRVAVLILLLTLAQDAACLIGAASLYFGTQGVISSYIRKKRKEHEEDE